MKNPATRLKEVRLKGQIEVLKQRTSLYQAEKQRARAELDKVLERIQKIRHDLDEDSGLLMTRYDTLN